MTSNEKWIFYDNPKHLKAWTMPVDPVPLTPKRNIHDSKIMLCIWWDQKGAIYYKLLTSSETANGEYYQLQLIEELNRALKEKRSEWDDRYHKVKQLSENARSLCCKTVQKYLEGVEWKILLHPQCSLNITPLDIYLFRPCSRPCSESDPLHIEVLKSSVIIGSSQESQNYFIGISVCYPKDGRKLSLPMENILNKLILYIFMKINNEVC